MARKRLMMMPLLAVLISGWAARGADAPTEWMHRAWTPRDHAPRFIEALAQDRDGFLWIGGFEGLFRFDGQDFASVAHAPGHSDIARAVSALAAGPDGRVWIGYVGGGGVSVYERGRVRDTGLALPSGEVTRIVVGDDGLPWVGVGDGPHAVYHLEPKGWVAVSDKLLDGAEGEPALISRKGPVWFTTWNKAPAYRVGSAALNVAPFRMRGGGTLVEMGDGGLWSLDGTGLRAVPRYDLGAKGPLSAPRIAADALPKAEFFRAVGDPYGNLWGTTLRQGAFRIDLAHGRLAPLGEAQGLTSDRASPLIADRDGNIWIGTESGLDLFTPSPLHQLHAVTSPVRGGYFAASAGGWVYLAQGFNVWMADGTGPMRMLARTGAVVSGLCAGRDGSVWAMSYNRLMGVAGKAKGRNLPLPMEMIDQHACAVAGDGTVWVSSPNEGLFRWAGGAWHHVLVPAGEGTPSNLALDGRDRLYVILGRRSLLRLDHGAQTLWQGSKLGFARMGSLTVREDDVLVGGMTGLLRVTDHGASRLDVANHPWLFDTRGVVSDTAGWTWVLGFRGLSRVRSDALDRAFAHPAAHVPHSLYDADDRRIALPQRDNGAQAVMDGAGHVYVLTRNGVIMGTGWQPPAPAAYKVFIDQAIVEGRKRDLHGALQVPHDAGAVTLTYGALDLVTSAQRRFRVRLAGLDRDWTETGTQRQVTYARLDPGTYRFEVQTNGALGAWQDQGAALDLTILPAFWQTWWFRIGAALALGGLLWVLYLWRAGTLLERARARREAQVAERERIARELHDTLMQGFQGMMLRFQAIAYRGGMSAPARDELETVLERGDDVLAEARERVMDLRMASGDVDLARQVAQAIDPGAPPPVTCVVRGRARVVCASVAQDMVAVVAEAVANARAHARASAIQIEIAHGWRHVRISIADNGVGPGQITQRPGHFGIQGMVERARRLHGALNMRAARGGGTVVVLQVPVRIAYPQSFSVWPRG